MNSFCAARGAYACHTQPGFPPLNRKGKKQKLRNCVQQTTPCCNAFTQKKHCMQQTPPSCIAFTHCWQEFLVLVQPQHHVHIVEQHQAGQRAVCGIIQAAWQDDVLEVLDAVRLVDLGQHLLHTQYPLDTLVICDQRLDTRPVCCPRHVPPAHTAKAEVESTMVFLHRWLATSPPLLSEACTSSTRHRLPCSDITHQILPALCQPCHATLHYPHLTPTPHSTSYMSPLLHQPPAAKFSCTQHTVVPPTPSPPVASAHHF